MKDLIVEARAVVRGLLAVSLVECAAGKCKTCDTRRRLRDRARLFLARTDPKRVDQKGRPRR